MYVGSSSAPPRMPFATPTSVSAPRSRISWISLSFPFFPRADLQDDTN